MGALSAFGGPIRFYSGIVNSFLSSFLFSAVLFGAAAYHLEGESGYFCSKAWENCDRLQKQGSGTYVNGQLMCPIRACPWPQFYDPAVCSVTLLPESSQSFYSELLILTNYWLRWIYTALIVARMLSMGLLLSENSFFRDFYCILDVLVMLSAWLNVVYPHGNLMFLMIIRGNQITTRSTYPDLAPLRVIVNSIINGASELGSLYTLISFFMGFFGLLAMSLIGSKGDFHNRCAVPLMAEDGTFTYEPLMPPTTCRMDHLYNPSQYKNCYGDVWTAGYSDFVPASRPPGVADPTGPGCQGTCGSFALFTSEILGTQVNLTVQGRNSRFGSLVSGNQVYCIGPDLFPLNTATFPPTTQENLPLKDYKSANLTNWPNILDIRSWDDIGSACISIYTVYYRSAWSDVFDATRSSTSSILFVVWVFVIMSITYYILNTSVGIICRNYSVALQQEADAAEARKRAEQPPSLDDDGEEDNDDGAPGDGEENDDEQDLSGADESHTIRSSLITEMKEFTEDNPCGKGCGPLPVVVPSLLATVAEIVGNQMALRVKALGYLCGAYCPQKKSPWVCFKETCFAAMKKCCRVCLTVAITFAIPDNTMDDYQNHLAHSPLEIVGIVSSFGTIFTLLMQQESINNYKCACSDDQINAAKNLRSLKPCTAAGECLDSNNLTTSAYSCVWGVCVENAPGGVYSCINPIWNPRLEDLRLLTGSPPSQPTALVWETTRASWCSFGKYVHFALYGWAGILLIETALNFLGHQGWVNYLTLRLYRPPIRSFKGTAAMLSKIPVLSTFMIYGFNFPNVIDAIANLATAAGIALTELSISSSQNLNGRVSYDMPDSAGDWAIFFSGSSLPWVFKFLRIAVLLRIIIRVGLLEKNSMCAAVIRGLRGIDRLFIGQILILYSIFLFSIIGKEFFDYGYSTLKGPFLSYSDFHDLPTSLVPLLNIMASGSFYEYAKDATLVFGVPGFVYISFYYFIVNFQVLNIFIAIIVQNYVLQDDEKLEAQKTILRANFEKAKLSKSITVNDDYEKSWSGFRRHYNELMVGAQLSLRSLMQFQRSVAMDEGPFNKELEDYLAGIDSSKDIMAKVERDEKSEAEKQQEREREVSTKLSIRGNIFLMKDEKRTLNENKRDLLGMLVAGIELLLRSQAWNIIAGVIVVFSTAMAVITSLPTKTEFYISVSLLAFFLLEAILKMILYGVFGRWTDDGKDDDMVKGGGKGPAFGGSIWYLQGIIFGKTRRLVKKGYLMRPWCILELLIIVVMVIDVYLSLLPKELQFTDPGLFKGLRSVRIIRLLTNLQRMKVPEEIIWKETSSGLWYPGLKFSDKNPVRTIMLALSASLPSIFLLMVIAFGMLIIFSLVGLEQFTGLLYACSNDADLYGTATLCNHRDTDCFPGFPGQCQAGVCLVDKQNCYGNKLLVPSVYGDTNWKSVNANIEFIFPHPRTWINARLNFDNAPNAFFATFCSISRSGVTFLMQSLGSITGRMSAPISGYSSEFYVYVIILNLVVGVFVCQVVIGIILTNLQLKSGYAFHTKEQLVWPATKNMFDRYFPDPKIYPVLAMMGEQSSADSTSTSKNPWIMVLRYFNGKMKQIQVSWKFNLLVTLTIFLNIGTLLSKEYDSDGDSYLIEFWIGFACFVVYVFEAFVKICADYKRYFCNTSDQIDFSLTVWNAMEIFVTPSLLGIEVSVASLRMFRLFNLLMKVDAMVQLVKMITGGILEALASGILLGFILFIFGCVGTRFFNFVKDGTVISPTQTAFTSLPEALITLFKLSSSTDTFLLDIISDSQVGAPKCTAVNWIPYGASGFVNPNAFGQWQNQDVGYVTITTDCGNTQTAYVFFLFYIVLCNYVVLPTYIAVVLNNVFEESVKSYSLVKEDQLKLFVEAWVLTFGRKERVTFPVHKADDADDDPKNKKKAKARHNFDNFDNLLMALDMKGCSLYIDKNHPAYKLATTKFREERGKTSTGELKPCTVECKELAAVLLSVTEKCRPVTIVDKLRRQLAIEMLQEEGKKGPEPKKRSREGQLHANVNLPRERRELVKKDQLEVKDIIYSYNVYVVLDQLMRLKENPITEKAHQGLKRLVLDDDEDLFVYFEEYVENSGPDYSKEECYKVLIRFKDKAVNVYSRSSYAKEDKGEDDENNAGDVAKADDEVETVQEEAETDAEDGSEIHEENGEDTDIETGTFGEVVDDYEGGQLDLRNWMACKHCGEPVEMKWEKCPSCRTPVPKQ